MPTYSTPGVPDPEVSAKAMRDATRALPDDTNVSPPRCYSQCVESPRIEQNSVAEGYQSQYTD